MCLGCCMLLAGFTKHTLRTYFTDGPVPAGCGVQISRFSIFAPREVKTDAAAAEETAATAAATTSELGTGVTGSAVTSTGAVCSTGSGALSTREKSIACGDGAGAAAAKAASAERMIAERILNELLR